MALLVFKVVPCSCSHHLIDMLGETPGGERAWSQLRYLDPQAAAISECQTLTDTNTDFSLHYFEQILLLIDSNIYHD